MFLVRHAKSSWDERGIDDFDRPLKSRGHADAPIMGRRLLNRHIRPDVILSSPANRAITTARYIARELNYSTADIIEDKLLYHATADEILEIIQEVSPNATCAILVGHNPGLTDSVLYLSGEGIENVPTCGVVEIEFPATAWNEVQPRSGRLVSFDYPKNVDA